MILQAVVRDGEKVMCNLTDEEGNEIPVTVIEYVVNDLKEDDLAFHNPLHRQILTEDVYKRQLQRLPSKHCATMLTIPTDTVSNRMWAYRNFVKVSQPGINAGMEWN